MDLTLQRLLFGLLAYAVIAAVHGFVLAMAAAVLGDPGPGYDGRRTLSPLAHADALGGLGVAVFGYGWIKLVALDTALLRGRAWGALGVVAAGLAALVVLAVAAAALRRPLVAASSGSLTLSAVAFLDLLARHSIGFALVNLLPLPPFTAGLVTMAALPRVAAAYRRAGLAFGLVAAGIVASGLADRVLLPLVGVLGHRLLGG